MVVVVALGGNALLRRGEPLEADIQRRNVARAAAAIAKVARRRRVVVTHGNGPQVGLLALQSAAYAQVSPYPLDVLGAESEGMIGYVIAQELANDLPERRIASLLTQVVVDPHDPAFAAPSKPIGPLYPEPEARRLAAERGWHVARDGEGFRRVVASPAPRDILELTTIRILIEADVLVVCAGGGGVPVTVSEGGVIRGVEAVIDKDRSAALLATELAAEALLILTDVDGIYTDWGAPGARWIREAGTDSLARLAFDPGSMGPKVEAACRFVDATGRFAGIGALDDAEAILDRAAGTIVRPGEGLVRS
jgi:carbamate kinase